MKLPPPRERQAWLAWIALFGVLCVLLVAFPGRRTVTDAYFPTVRTWWAGQHTVYYEGIWGFLYLPQSVFLFTPFAYLPKPLDEAAWRLLGLALFAFGLRRMVRVTSPEARGALFAWTTLLVIPSLWSSARNGQTNVHLAGFLLHAGADLVERRWWRSTCLLWLAMMAKPIALAAVLLVGALYRAMTWRLLLGLLVFAALPFLHTDWSYVLRQHELGWAKLLRAMDAVHVRNDDLIGALVWSGIDIPARAQTALRALAAVATLLVCAAALRRGGRRLGTFLVAAFAGAYLVLFNARTETNSYVLVVAYPALLAALAWRSPSARAPAIALTLLCLALGSDNFGRPFYDATAPWLKPLVTLAFALWLVVRVRALPGRSLLPTGGPS